MRYLCPHCDGPLEVVVAYVVSDYLDVDEAGRFARRDFGVFDLDGVNPQGFAVQCKRCFARLDDRFEASPDGQVHPRKEASAR